jgi:hypothetical protein
MSEEENFRKEWNYFCSKINFGESFLDARAICFMNEFNKKLDAIIKETKIKTEKEVIK